MVVMEIKRLKEQMMKVKELMLKKMKKFIWMKKKTTKNKLVNNKNRSNSCWKKKMILKIRMKWIIIWMIYSVLLY